MASRRCSCSSPDPATRSAPPPPTCERLGSGSGSRCPRSACSTGCSPRGGSTRRSRATRTPRWRGRSTASAYWDLAGSGATLDVGPLTGVVAIGWWEQSPGLPVTSVSYYSAPYDAVPLARWVTWGDSGVAIQGWLAVTEDGATWPGQLAVAHGATGGRALGIVDTDAGELIIERCWGPTGVTTWSDEGGVETGDPSTCVLSDVAPVADLL
jgi:hypothetical protein